MGRNKINKNNGLARNTASGAALVLALTLSGGANAETKPSDRGKEDFLNYCVACHGVSGRGDGPVAEQLKNPPADLTVLAAANGGVFPKDHVLQAVQGNNSYDRKFRTHGPKDMPIWGNVFYEDSLNRSLIAKARVLNVVNYIESLQIE